MDIDQDQLRRRMASELMCAWACLQGRTTWKFARQCWQLTERGLNWERSVVSTTFSVAWTVSPMMKGFWKSETAILGMGYSTSQVPIGNFRLLQCDKQDQTSGIWQDA